MEFLSANINKKQKHPILFLHGAYCDDWIWQENYMKFFADQGFDCYSLNFENNSSMFDMVTLDTLVKKVLESIDEIGSQPIIIGHSMAGAVLAKLYESIKIPSPAWILMAPAPPRNFYVSSQELLMNNPMLFSQMYILQMLGKCFVSPKLAKYALFSEDFNDEEAQTFIHKIKPMSNHLSIEIMSLHIDDSKLKTDFPVLLQAAKQDKLISHRNIELTENTFNVKAKWYDCGHAIMLDHKWQEAAQDTVDWINKNVK